MTNGYGNSDSEIDDKLGGNESDPWLNLEIEGLEENDPKIPEVDLSSEKQRSTFNELDSFKVSNKKKLSLGVALLLALGSLPTNIRHLFQQPFGSV